MNLDLDATGDAVWRAHITAHRQADERVRHFVDRLPEVADRDLVLIAESATVELLRRGGRL